MPAARFRQIRELLWADVLAGEFTDQLPSEPELALRYKVSRMTLRRAIASLAADGLLSAQQGRGTFIKRDGKPLVQINKVAVVLEDHDLGVNGDPFYDVVITTLASFLSANGKSLIFTKSNDPIFLEPTKKSLLCGIIAMAYNHEAVWNLSTTNLPMVLLESSPLPERTCILPCNREGFYLGFRHLLTLGHRRIAHLASPPNMVDGQERLNAWRAGLGEFNLPDCDHLVEQGYNTVEGGAKAMIKLLAAPGGRPTAVLCGNDRMALGALRAIREQGLRVPEDISLVGFDDIEAAHLASPPLTTITVPRRELARTACLALFNEIDHPRTLHGQTIRIPVTLTVRGSTGPVAG